MAALVLAGGVGVGSAGGSVQAPATVTVEGSATTWDNPNVTVNPGETVTWTWQNTTELHNVGTPGPEFAMWTQPARTESYTRKFDTPGVYPFVCHVHSGMNGTVTVTGTPTVTATPSVSATATPTASATPTATPTATPVTPAATPVSTPVVGPPPPPEPEDTVKPKLTSVSTKAAKASVQVRFKLSESAAVKVTVKRGSKTLKTVTKRFAAGTRTVTAKGSKITRGKVTVEIRATDAAGNASSLTRRSVSIKR